MARRFRAGIPLRALALKIALAAILISPAVGVEGAEGSFDVLLFTRAIGSSHVSTETAINAIKDLGVSNGFSVTQTEDPGVFSDSALAEFEAVVFLHTKGTVLDASQEAAFQRFIKTGKGFVGIHSAADTQTESSWYMQLVGAKFSGHPLPAQATVIVEDHAHPSSSGLPYRWRLNEEWYNFAKNPRGSVHVLASVDEKTYSGGTHGYDHPISWCQSFSGGRSWYTGMGHLDTTWADAGFRSHVLGGIQYSAGARAGDCGASLPSSFDRVTLESHIEQPMSLAILPDKRVLFLERLGKVKLFDPGTERTQVSGVIPVSTIFDHGLQGVAVDPGFSSNGWIYLFYSVKTPHSEVDRVSRFTLSGNQLQLDSEKVLLSIPIAEQCCHQGGSLAFDLAGNLLISTGDNTTSFASGGYTPIDERSGYSRNDAQRSSGNKHDLRGKILRITPRADGSYSIPAGNLFASTSDGLPEIYAMGFRNPFRMSVDPVTGWLYVGDVGPDANNDDPNRGPRGYDEINQISSAGNYGWPYCVANNKAYRDYDFLTGISGDPFPCTGSVPLVNDSPHANPQGGSQTLPKPRNPFIWYPNGTSQEFPELRDGRATAAAGPIYRSDPSKQSANQLPPYFDNSFLFYDWTRSYMVDVKLDPSGQILKMNKLLDKSNFDLSRPIDIELGPDNSLYVLEWGMSVDYAAGVTNDDARLIKIEYVAGKRRPVINLDRSSSFGGNAPLTVNFSAEGSYDPDLEDSIVNIAWDFEDDGSVDATGLTTSKTYPVGDHVARVTLTDETGRTASQKLKITSGNALPLLEFRKPTDGRFHSLGESVRFDVSVVDQEDGSTEARTIDCSKVEVSVSLGHADHSHALTSTKGCSGELVTGGEDSHSGDAELYSILIATYQDEGASGVSSVTGKTSIVLQPSRKQAEHFSSMSGVATTQSGDILGGGDSVGFTETGDWIAFDRMNLEGVGAMGFRIASATAGGVIEIRIDGVDGPKAGEARIPPTGSWQTFVDVVAPITSPTIVGRSVSLYLVFRRPLPVASGNSYLDKEMPLFSLNWIDLHGLTAGVPLAPRDLSDASSWIG